MQSVADIRIVSVGDWDGSLTTPLSDLMWSFVEVVETYCRVEQAPPYWFNERACVGLLAAAAWRNGWIALEEYGTRKVDPTGDDRSDRHGRCDLYLRQGKVSLAVEAKHVMAPVEAISAAIAAAAANARSDARDLFHNEATWRVGAIFACPSFPVSELQEGRLTAERLEHAQRQMFGLGDNRSDAGVMQRRATHAGAFPATMRGKTGPQGALVWPGVGLILQPIRRGR